jgi:hypothetical protein
MCGSSPPPIAKRHMVIRDRGLAWTAGHVGAVGGGKAAREP